VCKTTPKIELFFTPKIVAFQLEENVPIMLVCKLYRDVYRETDVAPFQVKVFDNAYDEVVI